MQVPERLALIGGSILLSSTLIFTLKSQASSIIPKVGHSISNVYNHIGDAQNDSNFSDSFQQAQKNGETTGTWGTAPYYIDNQQNMHIGKGSLQGSLVNTLGGESNVDKVKTINIDQTVQAPSNSERLFSGRSGPATSTFNTSLVSINGLNNLDVSQVTNMNFMFSKNDKLQGDFDLSSWDTSQVHTMQGMFNDDQSLVHIDLSNWKTDQVTTMAWMFNDTPSITNLNISSFNTHQTNTSDFIGEYGGSSLKSISLGPDTIINGSTALPNGDWKNGDQTINVNYLTTVSHAGTWTHQ